MQFGVALNQRCRENILKRCLTFDEVRHLLLWGIVELCGDSLVLVICSID